MPQFEPRKQYSYKINRKKASEFVKYVAILRRNQKPFRDQFSYQHGADLEMIQSTRNHYIVMQYCNGGNLRSYFEYSSKRIQESIFQPLAAQIVIGLKFLVQKQIIHRDIKPENILLHIQEYQLIKLAGFGFSKYLEKGKMAETMCGTPLYSSPEILKEEKYDFKADVWSFGVIMYEMLTGHLPYEANSIQEIQEKFKVQLPWNILEISQSAKDLLQRILVINQNDRLDIFQV